jgi:hypothetical protein
MAARVDTAGRTCRRCVHLIVFAPEEANVPWSWPGLASQGVDGASDCASISNLLSLVRLVPGTGEPFQLHTDRRPYWAPGGEVFGELAHLVPLLRRFCPSDRHGLEVDEQLPHRLGCDCRRSPTRLIEHVNVRAPVYGAGGESGEKP